MNSDEIFNLTREITRAGGANRKMALLVDELKPYLKAAYDPYVRYYTVKVNSFAVYNRGKDLFSQETWELLADLSARRLSGKLAEEIVEMQLNDLTVDSALLLQRILDKDLRMGVGVKTINKRFPHLVPTHDVMLAKLYEPNRVQFPCYGSPKIDGVRAIFKRGNFYSRNGHVFKGLQNLKESLDNLCQGKDIPTLDGELTVKNTSFQEGSGLIRNDHAVLDAQFSIFELPELQDTFTQRIKLIKTLDTTNIRPIAHLPLKNHDEVLAFYKKCRGLGYEGSVIKPWDYIYKGTRSYDWMKMKDVLSIDAPITGFYEGTGKYKGMLGGVTIEINGVTVKVGGGFSDEQRKIIWERKHKFLLRMIEVLYMEKTLAGSLRHSRFSRFRPDKD